MLVHSISDFGHELTYPGWIILKETYSFCRMYYITEGECFYEDDEIKIPLRKNTLYLMPTIKPYKLTEDPAHKIVHYYAHLMLSVKINNLLEIDVSCNEISNDLFNLIKKCIENRLKDKVLTLTELFLLDKLNFQSIKNNLLFEITNFINEHICNNLTCKTIASHFHYSEVHLSRLFKEHYNLSLTKFLHDAKLEYALKLLNENKTISYITDLLSFSSEANFSRSFKQKYGLSPRNYEKEQLLKKSFNSHQETTTND